MSAPLRQGAALARQRIAGVAFLLVIALLLWLSVAIYQKKFADVVEIDVVADSIGNQLSVNGDVKVRGKIIGRITDIESEGRKAVISLAIDSAQADLVPSDSVARLLPKTLFGEEYVSLLTVGASAPPIRNGDVLQQDSSARGIQTAEVLDDLLPLLRALDPQDLSAALNALSEALRGRGEQIGATLIDTRDYLAQLNPALPTIQEDLQGLADFADTVDEAAPDLLAVLDDLSFSSRSLQDQEREFAQFLSTTTSFANSAESVLRENERRIIRVASESRAPLELFADYAPVYGCLLRALDVSSEVIGASFGGFQPGLRITLEITRDQGGYLPIDEPKFKETQTSCYGLQDEVKGNFPVYTELEDGYNDKLEATTPGVQTGRDGPGSLPNNLDGTPPDGSAIIAAQSVGLLKMLSGPVLAMPPERVPDLAGLLVGPLLRGQTMSYEAVPD